MPMSKRRSLKSQQHDNDEDEDEKEEGEQPNEVPQKHSPKKITYKIRGQQQLREYHFLKTVKSMEELDKFRFKVCKNKWKNFNNFKFSHY
jgi:hypothetical protein